MNYYHPTTLEHIRNPLPAVKDWAKSTAVAVPDYDPATQQCRFVGAAWAVETNALTPTKADLLKAAAEAFKTDMVGLQAQYLSALLDKDTECAAELGAEADTRKADYLAELTAIREA